MSHRPTASVRASSGRAAAALAVLALLTGCSEMPAALGGEKSTSAADPSPTTPAVVLTANAKGRAVPITTKVVVTAAEGKLTALTLKARNGDAAGTTISGRVLEDGVTWQADGKGRLEPGTRYVAAGTAVDSSGATVPVRTAFTTEVLSDAQQAFPSVAPLNGETVGVGMPVIVTFDAAVTDHAALERHMKVTSTPAQDGSWYWVNDREVHWRPASYWKPGSAVKVDLDVNSVPAGGGIYGQESRVIDFNVGNAHVYKVNAQTHQMQVFSNGSLLRTIPITTGQPGFVTRSGTKVIMEKFRERTMDSETTGIGKDDPNYYRVEGVEYAMRLTYSGEFIHAAPWSVASQGHANVSHGCTGMSTANAAWLYDMSIRGDVVEYVGTDRPMTFSNGWGDWNLSFASYQAGSAL
jgi:lipoprotein-anchoring transpeptidase ErfK/SrfK